MQLTISIEAALKIEFHNSQTAA